MEKIKRLLFGKGDRIQGRIAFWNMCSSVVYSVQSAILLLVVTRIGGLYQAGIFSIIYTVTQTLASLGSYSMRSFQVSDAKNQYSFKDYFSSRVFTCALMLICVFGYAIYQKMPIDQIITIMMFSLYRSADGMEDVFHSVVHKEGRLDVVSMAMALRIVIATVCFAISFLITQSLLISSIIFALTAWLVFLFLNSVIMQEYPEIHLEFSGSKIARLLTECFPVFFGAILYNYLINAPKYAINRNLSEESQTIFNIIFMPVFIINVISSFIFKPLIGNMGRWWDQREFKKLVIVILRQCVFIIALTVVMIIGGYFWGCPILSFVFGVELQQYQNLLCMLLCFGGITSLNAFFSIVLTVIRKQVYIIVGYLVAFVVNMVFVDPIVITYGLEGAGLVYGLVMSVVFVVFLTATILHIVIGMRKGRKE